MFQMFATFNKLSTVYLVYKRQQFKSFVSQTTFIRLELSSNKAEKSCVSNFKIAYNCFKLRVTMLSAV